MLTTSFTAKTCRVSTFRNRGPVIVRATSAVDSFNLKDGRKVEVYKNKDDAGKAIVDKFMSAYKEEISGEAWFGTRICLAGYVSPEKSKNFNRPSITPSHLLCMTSQPRGP